MVCRWHFKVSTVFDVVVSGFQIHFRCRYFDIFWTLFFKKLGKIFFLATLASAKAK